MKTQTDNPLTWKELAESIDVASGPLNDEFIEMANQEEHGQLAIDIYQTDADLIVEAPIAGVKPEDLDISIQSDMLTIKGTRTRSEQVKSKNLIYRECHWGNFSRSIILPVDVIADRIDAKMKDGVLTVRLPKAKNKRSIKVKLEK